MALWPNRLGELPPYPLADVPDIKARLRAEGRRIIDMGVGDPRLPVPQAAVAALQLAAADPALQGYGFQRGLPAYREAVARWLESRYGRAVDPENEILPVMGSKEAIALMAFAALDAGDTALVPDPGYAPYFGGSFFAGARIDRVQLRRDEGFLVPPERIRSADGRLGLVYLNYPNNPTGACATPDYVREVIAACEERGATLLYDNAYAEVAFDGYRPPSLLSFARDGESWVEFHSFSKTFNMTGWRLGWAVGAPDVIAALKKVKTFFDTGSFLAVQAAGAAVLEDPLPYIEANLRTLQSRRNAAVAAFRDIGFTVESPHATLYLWMQVPTEETSESFCRRLLIDSGVVLMPGSAMGEGGEGFVRASLTVDPEVYAEAASLIGEAI
jgi:LL-diaminopimelate aminotransferase